MDLIQHMKKLLGTDMTKRIASRWNARTVLR